MDTITKSVEWSYPTSDNAKRFGFYKSGCWTVQTATGINPPVALAGYANRSDAMRHADGLNQVWSRFFLQFNNAEVV